ncbi:MAG: glycerol-3-phosphate 1-O-acyltransferase PlsY [Ruminococcaceae bacterium]|nr:glycerol-3-phosphate 1-O-acyltransferase PlsY [Oscillospiraceae bacterium]
MGMFVLALVLAAVCGYLIGGINISILLSRWRYGKDVRTMGSGNAGMTNMLRNFGKTSAIIAFVFDTLKGALAVFLGRWILTLLAPGADTLYAAYVAGFFTIFGHSFPVYFGFKGGKGVLAAFGVILAIEPVVGLILLAIFLLVLVLSKMVSLGSVIGISFYPVVTLLWCLLGPGRLPVFSTICAAVIAGFVVWLHRSNLQRIAAHTEPKVGRKKDK